MRNTMSFIGAFVIILSISSFYRTSSALAPESLVIVILSQKEGYHAAYADFIRKGILEEANSLDKDPPQIVLSHELQIVGAWTITPTLEYLVDTYPSAKWFFFCLENTVIRLNKLLNVLSKFKANKEIWIGHALYDHDPTIIHHFVQHKKRLKYPNVASGFGITVSLLKSLVQKISDGEAPKDDFSIDASFEFATFVSKAVKGVKLTHIPEICIVSSSDCATYPRFFHPCGTIASTENLFFAVKTCAKYHTERIPIIKKTWAKHVLNIGYFSDTTDQNLPEAYVVTNTTQGHCAKTYEALKEANKILQTKKLNWLIIVDDDTILSVARLLRLLSCYNPKTTLALGERYGFRVWDSLYGYDYLTGGAGLVLSAPLVEQMIQPGLCECPTANTPDDMYLFGACLSRIGVHPTHSSMFHQARPTDYATAYLASQEPISFHKFWMIDPEVVYDQFFAEADTYVSMSRKHTEL